MELAKSLEAADKYVPLSRKDATPQWDQIKKDNPYGFDIGKLGKPRTHVNRQTDRICSRRGIG